MAKGTRESAIRALINVWIKDRNHYCATCGERFVPGDACCEKPIICTNQAALKQFMRELKEVRETRKNDYASNDDKTMRFTLSLPANLYMFLNSSMRRLYNEQLMTKEFNENWFLQHFPQFQVPRKL